MGPVGSNDMMIKKIAALVLAGGLMLGHAAAQTSPGTSPLSGPKGGTNNGFMQFTGPASTLKTYTLPNASDTLATLAAIQTITGAKTFADLTLILSGSSSGTTTLKATAAASGTITLPAATDTLVGKATTDTLTNKTFDTAGAGNSFLINGLAATANTGTGSVVRATSPTLVTPTLGVATATSINKMAITAPASSSTLAVADGKTATISNTLTLAGTDATVITFQGTDTYVGRATTDTLTNKTLTAPRFASGGFIADANGNESLIFTTIASAINEMTLANAATGANPKWSATGGDTNIGIDFQAKGTGTYRFLGTASGPADIRLFEDTDNGTNFASIIPPAAMAGDRVLTLPDATDTLVGKATTDTFTNKTVNLTSNTLSGTTAQFNTALSDGDFATQAGTETLTNKTVNLTSNTLSGTTAQFNTALSDGDFATIAGTETLTNKTLTAPRFATGGFIADANGNESLIFTTIASAVNELTLANAATGANPKWTASGGDSNIGIDFQAKGTGTYRFLGTASGPADIRLFEDTDNGTNFASLIAPSAMAADRVLTLPDATDTLVGRATTDTLTNKTLTSPVISGGTVNNASVGATTASTGKFTTIESTASVRWSGVVTPAQITGNQDNYTATNGGDSCTNRGTLRISSDASRNITGLSCGQADGDIRVIHNVGAQPIVLKDDVTSTAANRFQLDADLSMAADSSATMRYDGTSSRWRAVSTGGSGGGGGSGTVTNIGTGAGLQGGPVTTTGTFEWADQYRRNVLQDRIYLAKVFVGYQRRINEFADGYKASDGVGSSTNHSVDTGNGRVTPSTAGGGDQTSGQTFTASNSSGTLGNLFDNSNATDWTSGTDDTGWVQVQFTSGGARAVSSYTITSTSGADFNRTPLSWTLKASNTGSFTGEEVTIDTQTTSVWGATEKRTFNVANTTAYSYYRFNYLTKSGSTGVSQEYLWAEMELITPGTTNNMTLVTASQTADATVTNGRVLLEYVPVDATTLNTDLTAEITCNGGSNWASATLSAAGTGQAGHLLAETADTACTSGTTFAARIKTLNNKMIQIYGTSLTVR